MSPFWLKCYCSVSTQHHTRKRVAHNRFDAGDHGNASECNTTPPTRVIPLAKIAKRNVISTTTCKDATDSSTSGLTMSTIEEREKIPKVLSLAKMIAEGKVVSPTLHEDASNLSMSGFTRRLRRDAARPPHRAKPRVRI